MFFQFISSISIILIFSAIIIYQDILYRKIKNKISLFYLFSTLSLILFFNPVSFLSINNLVASFISFFSTYILYKKEIWGSADTKIFFITSLLIIYLFTWKNWLNFIINLFLTYLVTISILSFIKTSKKIKIEKFKKLPFLETFFLYIISYFIMKILFFGFSKDTKNPIISSIFLISIFIIMFGLNKFIKKYFLGLKLKVQILISLTFFIILLFFSGRPFIYFLLILYPIKIFFNLISELSKKIKQNGQKYYSPFSIYIMFVAYFTIILKTSFIAILILH